MRALDEGGDEPDMLLDALELYRRAYLPWSDNEWTQHVRQELAARYVGALRFAAALRERSGAYLDALTLYRKLLADDMMDESAHAGAMRCLIALGNRAAAISQYQALRRILDEELGLEPGDSSEVEKLYHRILHA